MVDAVSLDCLTTCSDDDDLQPIQSSHLIPTSLQKDTWRINQLEYHWGMEKGQLNLHTPLNILHLSSDMKDSMVRNGWTLSPSIELLKSIMSMQEHNKRARDGLVKRRRLFTEVFPVGIYEYDFVPLEIQEPIFLRRLDADGNPTYTRYDSPYADLPRIKSNAHPFFVFYFSCEQIAQAITIDVPMDRFILTINLYQMWHLKVPSDFSTTPVCRGALTAASSDNNTPVRSADADQVRGVKRPHNDEEEEEEEDDDESSPIPSVSVSIRTPKDSTSQSWERARLDLSVLGSALLYDSTSLLRWIRGAP